MKPRLQQHEVGLRRLISQQRQNQPDAIALDASRAGLISGILCSMPNPQNTHLCETLLNCRRALIVGAHPDDVEFRAGGLVYNMARKGLEVTLAVATRGGRGLPGMLRRPLEKARERQQAAAACILGIGDIVFFDYPDGKLAAHVAPLTDDLRRLVADARPDVLLGWDPEFILSNHPDHRAAGAALLAASDSMQTFWYGSSKPDVWVGLDEEALSVKVKALKAHKTETPWFYFDIRLKKQMIAAMRSDGEMIGRDYAETFRFTRSRR